ncbi:OsmC-like protein [Nocardioides dokdonensis FR1436]|uniref:OsmC-like protein n=1 Tax=Nocardioides dokdonensis FR1436 TaxID=1300347 RepID=A0A1A9GNH6_9ACTN|nr:bifunctional alpha/beta hydrolase/OsmC family protein [Nocardioides dokdonensis]ANH39636.1 OsmC-like protein [Nocardioides dokdonensis FR1436]
MTRSEKFTFTGSDGHDLAGRLDLPEGEPRAVALFAHCFTCSKDVVAASRISRGLVERGYGVLRFDFTGLGGSDGEFANTSFTSNVDDLVAAAAALETRHRAPQLLVGHSLGGAAVIAAASRLPAVTAVATIGAPFDPGHVLGLFDEDARARIERDGAAEVVLAGRTFTIGAQLLEDVSAQRLGPVLGDLKRALLVLHSPIDQQVGVDNARQIYDAARHPKSFVTLDDADHLLTRPRDAEYVADLLSVWAARYLPEPAPATAEEPDEPGGTVLVEETAGGWLAQSVQAGRHTWRADEPVGVGDDTGPTPYDLLLSALGACTSMTLRMYARRKKLALEHVSVRLTHRRNHPDDCAAVGREGEDPCRVEGIHRVITLVGDLDDDARRRLLEIADRCPVHRTITEGLTITSVLAEQAQLGRSQPMD